MKYLNIFSVLFISFCIICLAQRSEAKRRSVRNDEDEENDYALTRNKHEYKKYSKEYSDESAQSRQNVAKKSKRTNKKRLQLDLDNVNEDELTSDERQVLEYRRKKLERQNKKTLGDVFAAKKQKNIQRKEKFEKHVLKHFKKDNDDEDEKESSEEIIAPLKRIQARTEDECDSSEEKCL